MPYFLAPLWTKTLGSVTDEQLWEHYEKCLAAYDWYFAMSDDQGVWRAGQEQRDHLEAVMERLKQIDEDRTIELYTQASPWDDHEGIE